MGLKEAIKYLCELSDKNGYVTFNEIDKIADEFDISSIDYSKLTNYLYTNGIVVLDGDKTNTSNRDGFNNAKENKKNHKKEYTGQKYLLF